MAGGCKGTRGACAAGQSARVFVCGGVRGWRPRQSLRAPVQMTTERWKLYTAVDHGWNFVFRQRVELCALCVLYSTRRDTVRRVRGVTRTYKGRGKHVQTHGYLGVFINRNSPWMGCDSRSESACALRNAPHTRGGCTVSIWGYWTLARVLAACCVVVEWWWPTSGVLYGRAWIVFLWA